MAEIKFIFPALFAAIASGVYHMMLIIPGKILAPFHAILSTWVEGLLPTKFYPLAEFITHSLRECAWCLAGQLSLLHYLLTTPPELSFDYAFGALFQTSLGLFFSPLILKILTYGTNET